MALRHAEGAPIVERPEPDKDRPSWAAIGIITILGFVAGVGWPRLAGVRLGPNPPETAASAVASAEAPPSPSDSSRAPAAIVTPTAVVRAEAPAPAAKARAEVTARAEAPSAEAATDRAQAPSAQAATDRAEASAGDLPAQVEWEVALIRDAPRTGKVIARLQRGTTIHVGSAKDGWYPVRYGNGYANAGWVYRGAIGH